MPRGDKSAYTDKQKRKAEHIEEGYEDKGVSKKEAQRRAWATVNKESGGATNRSGRRTPDNHVSSKKGGKKGGKASAHRPAEERSDPTKKAASSRRRDLVDLPRKTGVSSVSTYLFERNHTRRRMSCQNLVRNG